MGIPKQGSETAQQVAGIVAGSVGIISATSAGSLGVANAMGRLVSCNDDDDDDLPIMTHPLRFRFSDSVTGVVSAAVLSNCVIFPSVLVLGARFPVMHAVRHFFSAPGTTEAEALASLGWPSLLVMPFVPLGEGIGVVVTRSLRYGEPLGILLGLVGVVVVGGVIGVWIHAMARVVPRSGLMHRRTVTLGPRWWVNPLYEWEPRGAIAAEESLLPLGSDELEKPQPKAGSISAEQMQGNLVRSAHMLGEKRFYYAEFLSFVCSLIVGVAEGLPGSACQVRVLIAFAAAVTQAASNATAIVPLELLLQSMLGICVSILASIAVVQVFGGSDVSMGDLMDVINAVSNCIGLAATFFGIGRAALGSYTGFKRNRRSSRIGSAISATGAHTVTISPGNSATRFMVGQPSFSGETLSDFDDLDGKPTRHFQGDADDFEMELDKVIDGNRKASRSMAKVGNPFDREGNSENNNRLRNHGMMVPLYGENSDGSDDDFLGLLPVTKSKVRGVKMQKQTGKGGASVAFSMALGHFDSNVFGGEEDEALLRTTAKMDNELAAEFSLDFSDSDTPPPAPLKSQHSLTMSRSRAGSLRLGKNTNAEYMGSSSAS
eukprot:GILI01002368.1.p1 GENE.GILI01002368.1~~GILI01002368.1.p1  ORF type:complete len:602 (+),score=138.79 GILI01002368.1:20-1825(+)